MRLCCRFIMNINIYTCIIIVDICPCFAATSDNLEAISEAASSHSVGSDLDNENDNLSDMVSANVSGRGSPNISGRDTPCSQAESQVIITSYINVYYS